MYDTQCTGPAMRTIAVAIIVLAAVCSSQGASETNLLTNGSFRFGTGLNPSAWTLDPNGVYWDKTYGQDDSFSMSLLDNNPLYNQGDDYLFQTVSVIKGGDYRVTWWRQSEGYATFGDHTNIELTITSGAMVSAMSRHELGDRQWRQFTKDFTAGATTASIRFTADSGNLLTANLDDVTLDYLGAPALGDYNGDGIVDVNDYTVWRNAFGSANTAADGNGDGIVNAADYTVWRDHLGQHIASGNTTAVPEPSSLWLFLIAGLLAATNEATHRCVPAGASDLSS
jgi:hypothetical protein